MDGGLSVHPADKPEEAVFVGRLQEIEIQPRTRRLVQNGFEMGKRFETGSAVVGPDPGIPHSAEGQILVAQVHHRVVHATTAEGNLPQYFPDLATIP